MKFFSFVVRLFILFACNAFALLLLLTRVHGHNGHFVLSLNIFSWNEFGERQTATQRCIISAANVTTLNCIVNINKQKKKEKMTQEKERRERIPTSPSASRPGYRNADAFIPTANNISGHTSFTYDVSDGSRASTRTFPYVYVLVRARCLVQRISTHTHAHARINERAKLERALSRVPHTRAHLSSFREEPFRGKAVAALLRLPFLVFSSLRSFVCSMDRTLRARAGAQAKHKTHWNNVIK